MTQICSCLKIEQVEAGAVLAKQGSKAGLKLFFVVRGTVGIYRESKAPLKDRFSIQEIGLIDQLEEKMNQELGVWKGGNQKMRKAVQTIRTLNIFRNITMSAAMVVLTH